MIVFFTDFSLFFSVLLRVDARLYLFLFSALHRSIVQQMYLRHILGRMPFCICLWWFAVTRSRLISSFLLV